MRCFKGYSVLVISAFLLGGCATMNAKSSVDSDCAPNFTVEGSFWTGKTFHSSKEFTKVSKQQAFDNAVSSLATNGWQIVNSNKEQGLISASQGVIMGQGKTVPLNVVVKQNKNGVKVDLIFAITGGLSTSTDAVVEEFCKIYKTIND